MELSIKTFLKLFEMYLSSLNAKFSKIELVGIVFVFTICSCNSYIDRTTPVVNVIEVKKNKLNISEIAENIEYIPLANDSMLANIMKVVYTHGEYFVIDNKSKFLRFNQKGELLNPIGKRGRGPGEYQYVSDFIIHPKTHNIYIMGGSPQQLMTFTSQGIYIKSIELSQKGINTLGISGLNLFLFYLDNVHNVINMELLEWEGILIKGYHNKYEFKRGRANFAFSGEYLTYQFGGSLHFKEIFSDTVFCIEGQKLIPKLILNSENKRFTPEAREEVTNAMSVDRKTSSSIFAKYMVNYVIQRNLLESSKYLFYSYDFNNESQTLILDKANNKLTKFDANEGIVNDLDGGLNIQLKMNKDDNTNLSWIDALELKQYVESDAFKNSTPLYPEKKKQLEQLANSLDENDNPVLMLVKLKE